MDNIVLKKWIKFKNKRIAVKKENGNLVIENNTSSHGFAVLPRFYKTQKRYLRIQFEGEVVKGNSAILYIMNRKGEVVGETSLNSTGLVDLIDVKRYIVSIKISANATVSIKNITIEDLSSQEEFLFDDLKEDILVITPSYPTLENKYLCGFVHSRLKAYKESGMKFNVICAHEYKGCCKYNFEGIDVLRVPFLELRDILKVKKYKKILVHFFDQKYANIFDSCDLSDSKLYLWVHGPETLYWDWPYFTTKYFQQLNEISEEDRKTFLKNDQLIRRYNEKENVTWIFVSDWIRAHSEKLIDIKFKQYEVIPNIIDEHNFKYKKRDKSLRKKIFFIRRFDDINKYAIDVNVRVILELSRRECFQDMEFNIYGTGDIYETLIAPLRQFSNVHLYPQFLTHKEIANIHQNNGIALFATRYDAQGVSMCEAAMSGLVVVSSTHDAVKEFLPNDIGILAETEDYIQYADIIEDLYNHPDKFVEYGKLCHEKVLEKCSYDKTVKREIELFKKTEKMEEKAIVRTKASKNPILSIVIPSYQVAKYLEHGLKTLLNIKNRAQIEILIVNDGSKDNTKEVAEDFIKKYVDLENPNVILIDKENGGHGSTINVGLERATGKYFRVIDGDDWVDSEQLERLVELLENETSDIVITNYSEDRADTNELIQKRIYEFMMPGQQYNFDDLCYDGYGFDEWGPILATGNFKTEMLKRTNFKLSEKSFYVDMEFDAYSILHANTITFYPLDIYRYYIGRIGQSVSKKAFTKNYKQHENILFNLLKITEQREMSEAKKNYIMQKLIAPMAKAHYLIVNEYIGNRRIANQYDKRLKAYPVVYHHPVVATRFTRLHRTTKGFLLKLNPLLKKINEKIKRNR